MTVDALKVSDDMAARIANIKALAQVSRAVTQGGSKPDAFPEATQSGCSSLGAQAQGLASMQAAQAKSLASLEAKIARVSAATDGELVASGVLGPPAGTSTGAGTLGLASLEAKAARLRTSMRAGNSTGQFNAPRQFIAPGIPVQNDVDVFSDRQARQPKAKGKAKVVHNSPDDLDDGVGLGLVGKGGNGGGVRPP